MRYFKRVPDFQGPARKGTILVEGNQVSMAHPSHKALRVYSYTLSEIEEYLRLGLWVELDKPAHEGGIVIRSIMPIVTTMEIAKYRGNKLDSIKNGIIEIWCNEPGETPEDLFSSSNLYEVIDTASGLDLDRHEVMNIITKIIGDEFNEDEVTKFVNKVYCIPSGVIDDS